MRLPERYSVVRHVADGGMASVWEATDELLGRRVAVKVLSPALAADEAARRRFTREARAAARLSTNPHVVTVYDAGEQDGQAFMVMALYTGGTVADRLKAGPIARPQALDWLEDTAEALDLAHAEGVVHRDVKPANLLLDATDRVAVADFGIATAVWDTSMTSTGLVLGTLAYLAPEQRTGGTATPASDRYALGLVARELLTGARPGVAHPPSLPGSAEVALQRATAEDPAARPATCRALVAELETALGDTDATAATRPVVPIRSRAAAVPLPGGVAETTPARAAAPIPVPDPTTPIPAARPAAVRVPPPSVPDAPPGGTEPTGGRRVPLLIALAVVALLLGLGAALAASGGGGGGTPAADRRTTSTAKTSTHKRKTTPKTSSSASTPAAAAPPATPSTTAAAPAPATPAAAPKKSRAALRAQNDRAYAATAGDPAGQIAPLQEAVAGLCTDQSDIYCAYSLFNLAHALRLAGRPADAIPLLQRRLAISTYKTGEVKAELALAQQAAGGSSGAATSAPAQGHGKAKGKGKGEG